MSEAVIAGIVVFVLASFVGFEVIAKVPPTLHTPLMSGSNAISGITIVGALAASFSNEFAHLGVILGTLAVIVGAITAAALGSGTTANVLGLLAIITATINVVGGFMVTDRMLEMFKRKPRPPSAQDEVSRP